MAVKIHTNTARVDCRWAIGLLFTDGLMFVTKVDHHPKYFYWEHGKEPLYFESKRTADGYAFGMAANGYPAVVMEVPCSFHVKNNEKHISWARMSEIATILKDGLIEDDEEEAYRYMADAAVLSDAEAEYFGLDMEQYRTAADEDSDDNIAPSSTGGDYSPSNPWDAPGMRASDFI